MIIARRAVDRGQLLSWREAVRDHVDLAALERDPATPAWARLLAARLTAPASDTGDAGARGTGVGGGPIDPAHPTRELPPVALADLRGDLGPVCAVPTGPWPVVAADLAAATGGDVRAPIEEVARAYAVDPALADRAADVVVARAIDEAVAAAALGRLFRLLGDPARSRTWWQRAHDASPEDETVALELAAAMADAGDGAAGLQLMTRAAASWGDAGEAMLRGARVFASAGLTVDALALARGALDLTAPGDGAPAAALAARLLRDLDRDRDAASLDAIVPIPSAWDGSHERAAIDAAVAARATGRLTCLARREDDPALARRAAAALRDLLTR
jgi:hypothetical protein